MLQALQYIQSLSKRTLHNPVTNIDKPDVPEDDLEDLERVRTMLQLATPARASSGMPDSRGERRGEEEERDGEEEKEDDKAQQWIQAVLSTLQQTEDQMSPQKTPPREPTHSLKSSRPLFTLSPAVDVKQQQDEWTGAGDYGRSSWDNQGIRRHHRKFPLMLEDKDGQDQPLKRTNENAEEQYTPQKLATLQSVFEELSRMPNSELKADSKKQNTEDKEEGEENERYREKKMVFNDIGDEEELTPLEERTEQVEEETRRHEYNGGFGRGRDKQEKEENDGDREDKRSNRLDLLEKEDPDDFSRLVDFYLMKVLEKTEQEQKRDQGKENEEKDSEDQEEEDEEDEEDSDNEEERREDKEEERQEDKEEESEERDKRRASLPQYTVDPQSLYQLIQISKKLQVPPEDILDLLESERNRKLGKSWQRKPTKSQIPLLRYPSLYSTRKSQGTAPLYQQPLLQTSTPEMSSITQDILRILGLANMAKPKDKPLLRLNQYKSVPLALNYYMSERELPDYALSESSRDQREADYEDTLGEDELASLLAAEMLAQRPRRATPVHNYFDQAVQSIPENRQPEREENGESENSDEETLLRILHYLNPESEDADEMDINGKIMAGM